jgi:hypothetical protein
VRQRVVRVQIEMQLGERTGPCVLGDEAFRSGTISSFVSVVTATPCRVLAIPVGLFKACLEVRAPHHLPSSGRAGQ